MKSGDPLFLLLVITDDDSSRLVGPAGAYPSRRLAMDAAYLVRKESPGRELKIIPLFFDMPPTDYPGIMTWG